MKELSIEEKAKAYDEALERAKKQLDGAKVFDYEDEQIAHDIRTKTYDIFPELKESEDEKVRKTLIDYFKNYKTQEDIGIKTFFGISTDDIIAWLEKQGETFTKKDVDDAYLKGVTDTKNEIEKQYEANYQIRKDIATFIFNYRGVIKDRAKWMDYLGIKVSFVKERGKQENLCDKCKKEQPSHFCQDITALGRCYLEGEQKPTDKVEPFDKYKGLTDFEGTLADICIGWIGEEYGWKQYIKDNADALLKIAVKKFNSVQDVPFEQNPAWSEEDENHIQHISDFIMRNRVGDTDAIYRLEQDVDWLKSLKHRYTWKPSDEQMEALKGVQECVFRLNILKSLYNDLQKLKGE